MRRLARFLRRQTGTERGGTDPERGAPETPIPDEHLHAIFRTARDAIVSADRRGRIRMWNPAAEEIFGYAPSEVIGRPLTMLMPERFRETHERGIARYLATGEARVLGTTVDLTGRRQDGSEFPVELSLATWEAAGEIAFTGILRDVTVQRRVEDELRKARLNLERRVEARTSELSRANEALKQEIDDRALAEDRLRDSEARFARLEESGIIGIFVADHAGRLRGANDAFLRLVGYSLEEIASGAPNLLDITPPEWQRVDEAALEQLEEEGIAGPWEKEFVHQDGSRVPVLVGLTSNDHSESVGLVVDLSAQKRAEEALRRSEEQLHQVQKLETIGGLAGGVAHDFNNLLSVILSYSSILLADLSPDDPRRSTLDEIHSAGERAAALTRQLLAFSRQQILEPRVIDLNEVVASTERLLRRLIGEDIEIRSATDPELGSVKVDPGQIGQVIVNLAVNARDAMPRGGVLTIETRNVELDAHYASEHRGVEPGPHVMLAVSDTGEGMDEATRVRMFDPFFTTKERGRGTGLGLATVFGIVRQSGGDIWVYSERGRGTVIKAYFPRVDERADAPLAARSPPEAVRGGSETVLLAEDDERVRRVARRILEGAGYRVLEARSGEEAVRLVSDPNAEIHLLLTDVVMPGMSGGKLVEALRSQRPSLEVLLMSGYTDDTVVRHCPEEATAHFLQKPLTPSSLTAKVREILDRAEPRDPEA